MPFEDIVMFEDKAATIYYRVTATSAEPVQGSIIGESRWVMYVNGQEIVTFMATARNLHFLAIGFLASENLIESLADIGSIRVNHASDHAYWFIPALGVDEERAMAVCEDGVGSIEVRLTRAFKMPARRILTSGCGGGVTFDDLSKDQPRSQSDRTVHAAQIFAMMRELNARATLYRESRGVHTSALGDGARLVSLQEDIGRHNTLDKIRGECLLRGIDTRDTILIATGRISSEMITKAAKMQVPIIVSRTSPTQLALELARAWNMTIIGYARGGTMQVYHGMERVVVDGATVPAKVTAKENVEVED
ncbi:MAG: formate dehydrogenase accessory sulfurtransferase FdhD [Chloroflexi bacterium]|nr:formate dehydrogenase accessory sulfurtransferase FdhD [Chloroflexota bacterium]